MFSLSFWALLTLIDSWAWVGTQAQEPKVIVQSVSSVRATIGSSVTLPCTVISEVPGPVKWYKGRIYGKIIYSDKEPSPRGQRVKNTNSILDILISNITRQDEGAYLCVKFKKGNNGDEVVSIVSNTTLYIDSQISSGVIVAATAGSVCLSLVFLALFCYFKRKTGQSPCSARFVCSRPEASKTNQPQKEPKGNKEIVYADLQPIEKSRQSMSPARVKGFHSEYATIQLQ
ncbi:tyrosine-protein phosphatase non-receptor type substrate 1-like isoform X2 [Monodelphis domestica]|uniref:tyrosine-protein phosphatase non-receptor type substrate 1-like isoform X2 n=1 Tax=Monodelphis domestica TaxID=13616 RepID=UPI0004436323|nr:tyrosine-protein phosphatase non-receptor type substrate 1-like isoform X2 [Monodelphis domestica]